MIKQHAVQCHAVTTSFQRFPKFSAQFILFSRGISKCTTNFFFFFNDNGPHYHNHAVLMYLDEVNDVFAFKLVDYNNFEAGEGKTVLDTHFAHVSHKLVRWVHAGNDSESGEQLADLLEVRGDMICDTFELIFICCRAVFIEVLV